MEMGKAKLLLCWARARRAALLYVAVVFGFFFLVYALYGHGWGPAGYAALLGLAAGAVLAVWDIARFMAKHAALARVAGRFPTAFLPEAKNLLEEDYTGIIRALEAERKRLEEEGLHARRDAEEYYTLWAHQIKTPMAAMRLLLQAPGEGQSGEERAAMEQELLRMGQYVDMVLQYQRLSSLQNDLVLQRHELAALARKAAKNCAPLFIYKKLPLDMEETSGSVVTDEKWFCFVLEQLLTNAVKYTPRGAVRVYTQGECLVVEDSGIGIPPEDLPRVFERGFTGAVGRSERSSTGIGLYLCREILARLGFGIA
ncbi:sensor histidine kinase, partial [Ruminococcaceae bacterium OttesenSCG-928-O06]|nr:sensor histidine kinase [Ruminococcaceae bacterium OttesenSCG-928-O06]